MSTNSTRPRFQVTKASSLKKTPARKVGSEATKPKPGPKKVELPSYEEQDHEQGSQDEQSEGEDVEEEMAPATPSDVKKNLKRPSAPTRTVKAQRGPTREKVSVRAPPKDVEYDPREDTDSLPSHMKMLALTSLNKSVLPKGFGMSFFLPALWMFGVVNQACASLIVNKKTVQEAYPMYNSIFSRAAIFILAHMHILRAREFANVISDDQLKVLKRFRASFDFNKIVIPGPYVLLFQSIGVHTPSNRRFLPVVPSYPEVADMFRSQTGSNIYILPEMNNWTLGLGFIPYLLAQCSILANERDITREAKMKKTDDSDDIEVPLYFSGRFFVPYHRDRKNPNNFLGYKYEAAPSATSTTAYVSMSASHHLPFPDSAQHLKNVHEALPPVHFPDHKAGKKIVRLMDYFLLDGNVSFYSALFEVLAIEAKFFDGMTTFENIDVETGAQVTCYRTVELDGPSLSDGLSWFQTNPAKEDGITIESRVADITDTDLQIQAYSGLITTVAVSGRAAHTLPISTFDSVKVTEDKISTTVAPIYKEEGIKRRIPRQNPFVDEVRTHIYTTMARDFSEVL